MSGLNLCSHISPAFATFKEAFAIFGDERVSIKEELLEVNVINWNFNIVEVMIVYTCWGLDKTCVGEELTLGHIIGLFTSANGLVEFKEAKKLSKDFGSEPSCRVVFEAVNKVQESQLNIIFGAWVSISCWAFGSQSNEVNNKMLIQTHIRRINSSIYLRSIFNPMVYDFKNLLLELQPRLNLKLLTINMLYESLKEANQMRWHGPGCGAK